MRSDEFSLAPLISTSRRTDGGGRHPRIALTAGVNDRRSIRISSYSSPSGCGNDGAASHSLGSWSSWPLLGHRNRYALIGSLDLDCAGKPAEKCREHLCGTTGEGHGRGRRGQALDRRERQGCAPHEASPG